MTRARTPSQLGRYKRSKGSTYEREVAHAFEPIYPHAKRGLTQTRVGEEVSDVVGTDFWIETKHHRNVSIRAAYEQAVAASAISPDLRFRGLPPLVVSKDTGKTQLATMSLSDFLLLLERMRELQQQLADTNARIDAVIEGAPHAAAVHGDDVIK